MITFKETGLDPKIIRAIDELGFVNPTEIQEKTFDKIIDGDTDIIAMAKTGTGKTAAFGLPLIQQLDLSGKNIQVLVLCPTRELCIQITKDLDSYGKYYDGLRSVAVYGGASIENQISALKKGAQIVVGTPGRMNDLIRRKVLKLHDIKNLVLDEADEMLNMGFKEEIDAILETTPKEKRTFLFSATMPPDAMKIANNYMHSPITISAINKEEKNLANIKHQYYLVNAKNKYKALRRIADYYPGFYAMVFCRTRAETKDIAEKLMADGYNADALHGDLSQAQRDYVMNRFRMKGLQILVATDVAARGIDVSDITHVINLSLPDETEVYVHRSGRTGRAGKNGISISIIHSRETGRLRQIEKFLNLKFEKCNVPLGSEICEKQLFHFINKVENIKIDEKQINQYLPVIFKKLDWQSKEELITRFVSVAFNRFLQMYEKDEDINIAESQKERRGKNVGFTRFFINIGSKNNLTKSGMIGMINERLPKKDIEIGKIDIMKGFSFFEIDQNYEQAVLKGFKKSKFRGVSLSVEVSKEDKKRSNNPRRRKK